MTRRLAGFVAAAALAGGVVLSAGAGSTALAGNSWDRSPNPSTVQDGPRPGSGDGNSWD